MEKGRDIKNPHASLSLSRAESVSRCWSLVDIHTSRQSDANWECATRLRDTCLHSVVLGHQRGAARHEIPCGSESEGGGAAPISVCNRVSLIECTTAARFQKWRNILCHGRSSAPGVPPPPWSHLITHTGSASNNQLWHFSGSPG